MTKIIISTNLTLDGVIEDPTGEEGFEHGGWFLRVHETDAAARAQLQLEEALNAEALLFGRRGYEFFAARWPSRPGALADRLNSMPKYVASSTLHDPEWHNTTVLDGDAIDQATTLKQRLPGNTIVYASLRLAQALIEHHVADELRLLIHPIVLGSGRRLFDDNVDEHRVRLIGNRAVGDSLVLLTYECIASHAEQVGDLGSSTASTLSSRTER